VRRRSDSGRAFDTVDGVVRLGKPFDRALLALFVAERLMSINGRQGKQPPLERVVSARRCPRHRCLAFRGTRLRLLRPVPDDPTHVIYVWFDAGGLILVIAHRRSSEDVGRMRVRGKANIGRDGNVTEPGLNERPTSSIPPSGSNSSWNVRFGSAERGGASAAICAQNDTVPDPLTTGRQSGPSVSLTIDHQTGLLSFLQDHSESLSSAVFVADQKRQTERGRTK
jgi:hypothetical protein